MKKLLCTVLSLVLLLSMAYLPHASAVENHCEVFDSAINRLRWCAPYWDVAVGEAFPVSTVMEYTRQQMCTEEYGETILTEGNNSYYSTYAIPADVFEAAAADFFAIVDVSALRSYTSFFWDYETFTGIDDFQNYQPDREVYLFSVYGGMGDPSWYEVLGYTQEDGLYTVYSRFVSLLWGDPVGVEGVDYIRIGDAYYEITHYLETAVAFSNGRVQFHSWKETGTAPDVEMTTPLTVIAQNEQLTLQAGAGVFPEGAVVEINEPDMDGLQTADEALTGLATDFVVYELTASVQPNGTVWATFTIPEGFDADLLALFYISEDGVAVQLEAVVDADTGTVTAQLTHFSLYAVAQLSQAAPRPGDVNRDGTVNARDARLLLRYIAGLVEETEIDMTAADFNGDGSINARDARAILRHIAGLG